MGPLEEPYHGDDISRMAELIETGKPCRNGHIGPRYKSNRTCVQCNREAVKRYSADRERLAGNQRRYLEKHREKVNRQKRNWKRNNRAAVRGYNCLRSKRLKQATPAWLSPDERAAIRKFYRETPEGHHVDHFYPINGKTVCGLHVLANLVYLPAADNMRKSNSFPDE